jgi:hypothetical protein
VLAGKRAGIIEELKDGMLKGRSVGLGVVFTTTHPVPASAPLRHEKHTSTLSKFDCAPMLAVHRFVESGIADGLLRRTTEGLHTQLGLR